jgi:hypothetical protein
MAWRKVNVPSGNEQTGPGLCTLNVVANSFGNLHAGAGTTTLSNRVEIFKVIGLGESITLPLHGDGSQIKS